MFLRVTNNGHEMFVNTDRISVIAEVGKKSVIEDAMQGEIVKKKAAIYFEDSSPIVVDQTLEELTEAIQKQ